MGRQHSQLFPPTVLPEFASGSELDAMLSGAQLKPLRRLARRAADQSFAGYALDSGTDLWDCSNDANFTFLGGAGVTKATDSAVRFDGLSTTRITIPAGSNPVTELGVTAPAMTFPAGFDGSNLVIPIRCDNLSRVSGVVLYVGDSGYVNFNVSGSNEYPISQAVANEWHLILPRTQTPTGSPNWTGLKQFKIRVNVQTGNNLASNVHIGAIRIMPRTRPKLLITFDDGWRDSYTFIAPLCKQLGLPVQFSISQDLIGSNPNFLTERELCELITDPSGLIECTNHSRDNTNYSVAGLPTYLANVIRCRDYLDSLHNNPIASRCHVYVQGAFDGALISALKTNGFVSAREVGASDRAFRPVFMPDLDSCVYALPASCNLEDTQPVATVKGYIQNAITRGGTFVIMGHRVLPANGTLIYSEADFENLARWLAMLHRRGFLDVMLWSDWVQGLRGRLM